MMNWIEKLQKISGSNNQLAGGIIGLLILLPTIFIGIYNGYYGDVIIDWMTAFEALIGSKEIPPSTIPSIMSIVALNIFAAIAFLISGILYLARILKDAPILLKIIPDRTSIERSEISAETESSQKEKGYATYKNVSNFSSDSLIVNEICKEIKRGFSDKRSYYSFVLLILTPFLLLDIWFTLIRPDREALFNPSNRMQLAFDMYGKLVAYFIEFLMATMLWIIIYVYKAFKLLGNSRFRSYIKIDLFSIDGIGGLGQARDTIKDIALYYFGCMTLSIMGFSISLLSVLYSNIFLLNTKKALEFSYLIQILIYIIFLILGLYYLWQAYLEIRKIFKKFIFDECRINSKIYNEKRETIRKKFLGSYQKNNSEEINQLRTDMEIINADRDNLMRSLKGGLSPNIIVTIVASFLSSLVIPILTMIKIIQEILKG